MRGDGSLIVPDGDLLVPGLSQSNKNGAYRQKWDRFFGAAFSAVFLIAVLDLPVLGKVRDSAGVFWNGQSGVFNITWSLSDLSAKTKDGALRFSARIFAGDGFTHFKLVTKDPITGRVPNCQYERQYALLAVVGSMISFIDRYYSSCRHEAHPGGETRFTTIDLAKPGSVAYLGPDSFGEIQAGHQGKAISLTDLFSEKEVLAALATSDFVLRATKGKSAEFGSLRELLVNLTGTRGSDGICFLFPSDLLTRFTFAGVKDGKIEIQLGLPGDGPCRDNLTQFGLALTIPEHLRTPFERAANKKEGFLTEEPKIENSRATRVVLCSGLCRRNYHPT